VSFDFFFLGQMDALLDAEKIRTEMKSTKEECDALKKQLFEMNDSCTTLQGKSSIKISLLSFIVL